LSRYLPFLGKAGEMSKLLMKEPPLMTYFFTESQPRTASYLP
jgi:hypothetical protein